MASVVLAERESEMDMYGDNGRSVRVAQIHSGITAAQREVRSVAGMCLPAAYKQELVRRANAEIERLRGKLAAGSL